MGRSRRRSAKASTSRSTCFAGTSTALAQKIVGSAWRAPPGVKRSTSTGGWITRLSIPNTSRNDARTVSLRETTASAPVTASWVIRLRRPSICG